jgi:hypothetical protein
VRAFSTTTGWRGSNASDMRVTGTAPVASNAAWLSSPGTFVTISAPGLKPSLRLYGSGAMRLPARFAGIDALFRFRRRPVSVVGSATVKWSFGHGKRQSASSMKSHRLAFSVS